VVAPIGEEILFRGVIQTYFTRRLGVIAAIFISSFWFALIHMDAAFFAPLFVIGAALGLVRHLFGTIWAPILLHSLNNLMSVFVS
ncbi:CPBP family intramembrane metalloprotease, partial [Klebsiella pneumoniae]|nr:CPBP family intramembrane metalloprotease [Klebsiella pneumoniae]